MCLAFPDVCKVPAPPAPFVPAPFPNTAQLAQATSTVAKVQVSNKDAAVMTSKIPMSSGDEPGTLGGMISAVFKNQCAYKKGSSKVFAQGKAFVHLTAPTGQNGTNANAFGAQIAPSQVNVIVMP